MIFRKNPAFLIISVIALSTISLAGVKIAENEDSVLFHNEAFFSANEGDFDKIMDVITHQRCMNCHPSGDKPKQGEDGSLHNLGVERGPDDHGFFGYQCSSCHQAENNNFSGVPGAPHWALAPKSMGWEGLSRTEIARAILDRSKNGNRSLEEIVKHLTEDKLVLWAWDPGVDAEGTPREQPPVPVEEFIDAVKRWAANGAIIPND